AFRFRESQPPGGGGRYQYANPLRRPWGSMGVKMWKGTVAPQRVPSHREGAVTPCRWRRRRESSGEPAPPPEGGCTGGRREGSAGGRRSPALPLGIPSI